MKLFHLGLGLILFSTLLRAADRPNVLVILVDDLGYSDLGCYGGEIPTPNLDRLASTGARFSRCYNSARCCPTRASLLTGLHPHEAGIGSFTTNAPEKGKGPAYTGHLLEDNVTIAEMLKASGYSTWMVGKWHVGKIGPIKRGFDKYYGYRNFSSHSENQWDPQHYVRLPADTKPELKHENFYVTDVFTDYTIEFIRQSRAAEKPWFGYLAHSSPHFPVQAPKASIDRHMATYRKGWDVLRAERFERMKKMGMIAASATLPPRAQVAIEPAAIANGFSGKENPAWNSLPADRREDLARRMATYAAMVEHVDQGIGRILADLDKNGELANTLILFTSDNGACYEWGPFGFDGKSREGFTKLHTGAELDQIGQNGTHHAYGSGWANLCNTPLSMYKHFCHEGGISSPLIVHWPQGFAARKGLIPTPAHVMDILPTIAQATQSAYPKQRNGVSVKSLSGASLMPALKGETMPERIIATEHQEARGLRQGDWKIVWGKRQPEPIAWELYNLANDPSEENNLAASQPEKTKQLADLWFAWAKKVGVYLP